MAKELSARQCFEIYDRRVYEHMKKLMDGSGRSNNFIYELKINCFTEWSSILRESLEEMADEEKAQ